MRYLFVLFFSSALLGQTINDFHPRIWITPSDISTLQARVGSGGAHESLWNAFTSWCDDHISDGLSSSTDYDEHLYRYALAHLLTSGDETYGERVVTILNSLADNAGGWSGNVWNENTDRSGGDGNEWWYVPSALGVAYDWTFDIIDGHANETAIEAYLQAVIEKDCGDGTWSGATNNDYDMDAGTWHKTEENWGYITLALALSGEQGSTANSRIATVLGLASNFIVEASNDWSGSYVRSYNYISEDGYPLYTNGYENDVANSMQYVIAWHTATTDDLTQYPYWCNKARAGLALLPPDGSFPKIGEVQPYGTTGKISSSSYMANTIWYLGGDYINGVKSGYYDAVLTLNSSRAFDDWADLVRIIWTDGTEDYTSQDRAYHFDKYGGFVFRSGWDFTNSTDIVGEIRGFKPYKNDHWIAQSGHLDLRRGSDYLLVSGGAYTGGYWNHASSNDYNQDSDGQNTIHIGNREHRSRLDGLNDAGTSMADDEYGETKRFQFVDGDYVYGFYDMTNAFQSTDVNHSTGAVYRQLAFLDNQWIFLHDFINKVSAADNIRTLWHMDSEPIDDGSGWTDSGQSASTTGRTSTNAEVFNWTEGSSKTWVRVVEPTSGVTFRKRGGSWGTSFVDIDGTNHTVSQYSYAHWGLWTVETEIENPGSNQVEMLYTIQAKSSSGSETSVERISSVSYTGACIRATTRCAALFSNDGNNHDQLSFSVTDNSGTIKVIVANLDEGIYTVNGAGSYNVDTDGVLYFEANLGTSNVFTILQGEPDVEPPSVPSIKKIRPGG